jgi:oligoribonuclease
MSTKDARLIWIDLEMTGLDSQHDSIIEIATIVTDAELKTIEEGPVAAVHHPEAVMNAMDEWNTRQHGRSGLIERVRISKTSMAEAEQATLAFLRKHVTESSSPMCGNSICQDRRFLARQMPELESFFHYRNLDVSSLKILAGLWAPGVLNGVSKKSEHLALADIRDSIEELRHYRAHLFRIAPEV